MVKKIMHDPLFLAQKSVDATEADKQIVTDLLDTLRANLEHCVGMAANMIGVNKNAIIARIGRISDGGRMSFSGRCKTMHEISGHRSGLS